MRLSQIVALVGPRKENAKSVLTAAYQNAQKPANFAGQHRQYRPLAEGGETLPAETHRVQMQARHLIRDVTTALVPAIDTVATQDLENCEARGTFAVGGLSIELPVTHLLYLEKQLTDLRTFVAALPELPQGDDWTTDAATGLWKSDVVPTHRTAKVQKPIVLYDATDKHPAQTQLVTEDVTVGHWMTQRFNGGMTMTAKREMLARLDKTIEAAKTAREEANTRTIVDTTYANQLLAFIFG